MTDQPPADAEPTIAADPRGPLARARDAIGDAVRFFTRLPVPAGFGAADGAAAMQGAAAAAALAGALVGAAAGVALILCLALGLPPLPAATFAVAAAVALSGALHLDGLADVADGFGGGKTRERKLEIMRDSRIGVFGGSALGLALIARVTLASALVDRLGAADAALALVAAAALSRPLAFLPTTTLPPARADGLGRLAQPSPLAVATGCGIGGLAALVLGGPAAGVAAIALAGLAAASVAALARRQIGGVTGDVCGAAAELAEIAALAGLLIAARPA